MATAAKTASSGSTEDYPLVVENVCIRRHRRDRDLILRDINIKFRAGEIVGIGGPSGSGKTTLLKTLNRYNEQKLGFIREGQILLRGVETKTIDPLDLTCRVGQVMQQQTPFPGTIFKNAALLSRYLVFVKHHSKSKRLKAWAKRKPLQNSALEDQVEVNLRMAGLWDEVKDRLYDPATSLSGGQTQRLCIARQLGTDPEVLLFDEPTSALDAKSAKIVQNTLRQLNALGILIIFVAHTDKLSELADRVIHLENGEVVHDSAPTDPASGIRRAVIGPRGLTA